MRQISAYILTLAIQAKRRFLPRRTLKAAATEKKKKELHKNDSACHCNQLNFIFNSIVTFPDVFVEMLSNPIANKLII